MDVIDGDNATERRSLVTELCRLTLRQAAGASSATDAYRMRDDIDDLANRIRGRRRERPGDEVAGYKLLRIVGSGNFATVWEGVANQRSPERAAVKIFDQAKLGLSLMLWRFQRGIRAMQHMSTMGDALPASVVRLHEVAPDGLSFSMDFLPGGDLQDLHLRGWSLRKKLDGFIDICNAVAFAHGIGVIHRDIKPANIVLTSQHRPVLTDFDIADIKFAATKSMQSSSLGTPQFAAPEQLASTSLTADVTADIYSLGKLLYFMVTEVAPPLGSTEPTQTPPYLYAIESAGLRSAIAQAIQNDPARRFASVSEFVTVVQACAKGTRGKERPARKAPPQPVKGLSDEDIDDMIADVLPAPTPPRAAPERAEMDTATAGSWPAKSLAAGIIFGAAGFVFFAGLVIASVVGFEVPKSSRFLAAVVLALTLSFSAGLITGTVSARGVIPIAGTDQHPIRFAATGGVATFVVVMVIAYVMYL